MKRLVLALLLVSAPPFAAAAKDVFKNLPGVKDPAAFAMPAPPKVTGNAPSALVAAPIAYAKAAVEMPMVRAAMPSMQFPDEKLPWDVITAHHASDAKLDANAQALMRAKNPMDWSDPNAPKALDDVAFPVAKQCRPQRREH